MRKIALYFALLFSAFCSSNALSEYPTTIDKNSLKVFFDIFDLAGYATPPDPNDDLGAWVGWKRWYEEYYRTPFHRSLAVAYPKNNIKSGDFSGFCFIPGWTNRNEADAAAIDCCNEFKEKSHTCTILFRNNDILDKNYLEVLNPKIPANAYASGTSWKCKSGYEKNRDTCKKKEIPANAKVSGSSWTCIKGYKKVGSRCNKIYVPANASLSGSDWKCNTGYTKIGSGCQMIPANASVTSSGWKCNTGYTKEGIRCKKVEVTLDYVEELKKIKELLDSGIINQDDFEKMKQKIINSI